MSDEKPTPSLEDLDAKLREARARHAEEPTRAGRQTIGSGLGFALGIGLLLDYWLDTTPWLMVVFFFLGSAAGFLNVYRVVSGYGYAAGYRGEDDETKGNAPRSGDEGSK